MLPRPVNPSSPHDAQRQRRLENHCTSVHMVHSDSYYGGRYRPAPRSVAARPKRDQCAKQGQLLLALKSEQVLVNAHWTVSALTGVNKHCSVQLSRGLLGATWAAPQPLSPVHQRMRVCECALTGARYAA